MSGPPIIVTGADRSGTTLLYTLLASHPELMMVRRTNLWRWFDGTFGDLEEDANLERCLDAMARYRRLDVLGIDPSALREELLEHDRTYGRLFRLAFEQEARRRGRDRWGDKSLHTELHADRVFEAWPDARIVHMVRDPRDRYTSVVGRRGEGHNSIGSIMGRWLKSVSAGERRLRTDADRYMMLRFEDLVHEPESVMRRICSFLELDYDERMFEMGGGDDRSAQGANSSFDAIPRGRISSRPVGRYRDHLDDDTVATIQGIAARPMRRLGYQLDEPELSPARRAIVTVIGIPAGLCRTLAWRGLEVVRELRGRSVPDTRLRPDADTQPD